MTYFDRLESTSKLSTVTHCHRNSCLCQAEPFDDPRPWHHRAWSREVRQMPSRTYEAFLFDQSSWFYALRWGGYLCANSKHDECSWHCSMRCKEQQARFPLCLLFQQIPMQVAEGRSFLELGLSSSHHPFHIYLEPRSIGTETSGNDQTTSGKQLHSWLSAKFYIKF